MRKDEREKEDWRRMDEKERDECRRKDEKERDRLHLQMIAMMSGGRVNVPTNPRVIIKSLSRPSAPAVQIRIESLPQLIRCDMVIFLLKKSSCFVYRELKRLFDSSGKEVLVKQDGVEVLLTDCDIDWPPKMKLNMAESEISGVMTQVFVLDPMYYIVCKDHIAGSWYYCRKLRSIIVENYAYCQPIEYSSILTRLMRKVLLVYFDFTPVFVLLP